MFFRKIKRNKRGREKCPEKGNTRRRKRLKPATRSRNMRRRAAEEKALTVD